MNGSILIPHVAVVPTGVVDNGMAPPEIEVRFDLERLSDKPVEEWPNWHLAFLHNQLFEVSLLKFCIENKASLDDCMRDRRSVRLTLAIPSCIVRHIMGR